MVFSLRQNIDHGRPGFTLAELMVGLIFALLIVAVVVQVISTQMSKVAVNQEIMKVRRDLDEASTILSTEIRSVNPSLGFTEGLDTAMQFFSTVGLSTVCGIVDGEGVLLPSPYHGTLRVSEWTQKPDSSDVIALYLKSHRDSQGRAWTQRLITSLSGNNNPNGCGFMSAGDGAAADTMLLVGVDQLQLSDNLVGTPVRFLRNVRYSIYRASDNGWYLGMKRCPPYGNCTTVQPISGPYSFERNPPFSFQYLDSAGVPILYGAENMKHVRRVTLNLTGYSRRSVSRNNLPLKESVSFTVSLRNGI